MKEEKFVNTVVTFTSFEELMLAYKKLYEKVNRPFIHNSVSVVYDASVEKEKRRMAIEDFDISKEVHRGIALIKFHKKFPSISLLQTKRFLDTNSMHNLFIETGVMFDSEGKIKI
jgi:hypothetical protein